MADIISKELLSEVLGLNIDYLDFEEKAVIYGENIDEVEEINIHELAFKKCKEWAINQRYIIESAIGISNGAYAIVNLPSELGFSKGFQADTEPEAIFQATQYIYDNLSNS